jgi:hypothetical protein
MHLKIPLLESGTNGFLGNVKTLPLPTIFADIFNPAFKNTLLRMLRESKRKDIPNLHNPKHSRQANPLHSMGKIPIQPSVLKRRPPQLSVRTQTMLPPFPSHSLSHTYTYTHRDREKNRIRNP